MSDFALQTNSRKRMVVTIPKTESEKISATEYLNLIQRDGILKNRQLSQVESAMTLRMNRKLVVEDTHATQRSGHGRIDYSLLQLTFSEANIWLLPVNSKKMAVQWHLPTGMRRNCLDIFKGEDACFVLRIYQNLKTPSGWKKSQRTLEFEIDIDRNCCYINLENSIGLYTAELGLRCSRDRHIFIARSTEIRMPVSNSNAMKKIESEIAITNQAWSKNHPLKHYATQKTIMPEDDCGWDARDIVAEEDTEAVYRDFIVEGQRSLRIAQKAKESDAATRKTNLTRRKVKVCLPNQNTSNGVSNLVSTLCANRENKNFAVNKFQVVPVSGTVKAKVEKKAINQKIQKKIDAISTRENPAIVNCSSLREKISKLKDKAEIILRGKVKRPGQRVRVGGLLIEPEEDGSFCVACVIRNGKLYVPVEEVSAICEI